MKAVIIIPARYASSRYPGKPLAQLRGKSLVQRVWGRCVKAVSAADVYIATDDERISEHCQKHGMNFLMTPDTCLTGTDRVFHASQQVEADIYINVQGDEPMILPADIRAVILEAERHPDDVINAVCEIKDETDFRSVNVPKMVSRPDGRLLYASRAAIPTNKKLGFTKALKQVCIYSLPKAALTRFAGLGAKTPLESVEDIEILRFLELGFEVRLICVSGASIAVDVPEDIERVERALAQEEARR